MIRRSFMMIGIALTSGLAAAGPLAAQAEELGRQTLGRPYWHVFISYAIAWVLIFGWVIAIARRLGKVERSLQNQGD